MSKRIGDEKIKDAAFIEQGETAKIEFTPKMPLYLEPYSSSKGLDRIAVMDSNTLVMLDKVISVKY